MASNEPKTGGHKTKSQAVLYAQIEPLADRAIERLEQLLESRNESIALGAVKTVLERCIPIKKAVEVTGANGEPIKLNIISASDYLSTTGVFNASSTSGYSGGSTEVQGSSLAQESPKNDNSNKSDSEVGST